MKNLHACESKLRSLPLRAREALLSARRTAVRAALDEARISAPRRTGKLSNSLHSREENETSILSAKTPYAAFVERGTRRVPARPFLLPAAQSSGYAQKAADELRKAMKR